MKVLSHANATGPAGVRVLNAPGDVFEGDQVETDEAGQAQIRFVDNTRFVVGPHSRVVIDKFLFKSDGTATDVALNALKGTFRFITGKSPKEAYSIKTPTMSIVVRGTIIDFHVLNSGESIAAWQEGSGTACVAPAGSGGGSATECQDVQAGGVVGSNPNGGFKKLSTGGTRPVRRVDRRRSWPRPRSGVQGHGRVSKSDRTGRGLANRVGHRQGTHRAAEPAGGDEQQLALLLRLIGDSLA